jgi:N-acetylmuramoyl-L-alanine amidase
MNKRILIDPGHSERRTGARGKNSSVQEEDLNRYQAERLAVELALLGFAADIIDPLDDDLWAIGKAAQGYAAFVSLHLNAYNGKDHYTCAMVHQKYKSGASKSAQAASAWAKAISAAIKNPCFCGSAGYPEGVMARGLSVLSGAADTDCPIAFLSEAFFVDAYDSNLTCRDKIMTAMKAGAKALADMLSSDGNS